MKQRKANNICFRLFIIVTLTFLVSCGVFVKRPIYKEKPLVQRIVKDSIFCYQDSTYNFIDYRKNDTSKYIVIAMHGLGAHAVSFSYLQNFLDEQNIASLAMDLRGFGHWPKQKGDVKNIGLQLEDVHQLIQNIRVRQPDKKIILLGESLGSSLAIWYSVLHPQNVDGLILTSLVTSSGSNDVKFSTVLNLLKAYVFNPSQPVKLDYDPNMYSNDSIFVEWAYTKDTLGTRAISPRYLIQANRVIKKSYNQLCQLNMPILIMQGGKDVLSSKKEIKELINNCNTSTEIDYIYYEEMKHSIVNDKNRDVAFKAIEQWINKH